MTPCSNLPLVRRALLGDRRVWRDVLWFDEIDSTNAESVRQARPGLVVAAGSQLAGRGRLGRQWSSPPGQSLAVSVSLPMSPVTGGWMPLLAGLAVAEGLELATAAEPVVKWPNDVLLEAGGWRKVSGILCETTATADGELVVVGFGINVGQHEGDLPVPHATSLALAGYPAPLDRLVVACVAALERWYGRVSTGQRGVEQVRSTYRRRCVTIGQQVRVTPTAGPPVVGVAQDVDDLGRLVVSGEDGRSVWSAGDVEHLRRSTGEPSGELA